MLLTLLVIKIPKIQTDHFLNIFHNCKICFNMKLQTMYPTTMPDLAKDSRD